MTSRVLLSGGYRMCSLIVRSGLSFLEVEKDPKIFNHEFRQAIEQGEHLNRQLQGLLGSRIPGSFVHGRYLFRNTQLIRYVCYLVNKKRFLRLKKERRDSPLWYWSRSLILGDSEFSNAFAVVEFVWNKGLDTVPELRADFFLPFKSDHYSEGLYREILKPIR